MILNRDFLKKYSSKIDFDKVFIELSSEEIRFLFMVLKLMMFRPCGFSFVTPPESEVVLPTALSTLPKSPNTTGIVAFRFTLPEKYSIFGATELVCVSDDFQFELLILLLSQSKCIVERILVVLKKFTQA